MGISRITTQLSVSSAFGVYINQKMADSYDAYLQNHRLAISLAWKQIKDKIDFSSENIRTMYYLLSIHDSSKYREKEYFPFLVKYYANDHNEESEEAYKEAWKHHYSTNPHHWRFWVNNGEGKEIPYVYMLEMILNWHAKSLGNPELTAVNQYEEERNSIILNDITREKLEKVIGFFNKPVEIPIEMKNSEIGYKIFENQKTIIKNEENTESSDSPEIQNDDRADRKSVV